MNKFEKTPVLITIFVCGTILVMFAYNKWEKLQEKKIEKEPEPTPVEESEDGTFADVASDVNKGVSALWLIVTAVVSFLLLMMFKGQKKKK